MKHFVLTILALLATVIAMRGDEVAVYRLNVQNFSELTVVDGVAVDYTCRPDSIGWAVFYTTPDKASQIMFENKAEHLTVRSTADETPIDGLPTIHLYSATLRKIENSGDSLLKVSIPGHIDELKIKQIGNGSIEVCGIDADYVEGGITAGKGRLSLEGKARKAKFKNVSTGPIDASRLFVEQANCFIFGTGNIDCHPGEQLRVYGAGSGKVYYHHTPERIINRGIGVKTHPASEKKL